MDSDLRVYDMIAYKDDILKITIEYDWPCTMLSPNSKENWRAKYKAQQKYKTDCFMRTIDLLNKGKININSFFEKNSAKHSKIISRNTTDGYKFFYTKNVCLNIFFYPPDKKPRDLDNLQARVKYLIDGAFLAFNCDDKIIKKINAESMETIKQDGSVLVEFLIKTGE